MIRIEILLNALGLAIREQKAVTKYTSDNLIDKILNNLEEDEKLDGRSISTTLPSLITFTRDTMENMGNGVTANVKAVGRFFTLSVLKDSAFSEETTQELIVDALQPESNDEELAEAIRSLRIKLNSDLSKVKLKLIARKINRRINKGKVEELKNEIASDVEELSQATVHDEAIVNEIILNSTEIEENVGSLFDKIKERRVFRTGLEYINMSSQGGVRTGETMLLGALSHHNKTGIAISITAGVAILNKFELDESGRKPLVIHLSFEDPTATVIIKYYEVLTKTYGDALPDDATLKDKTDYVLKKLTVNGACFMITYVDPTKWGFRDFFAYISNLLARGYYIPFLLNDYLDKMGSDGLNTNGPIGSEKRELLRRTRNFMYKNDISYCTPWQLNSNANSMLTNGLNPLELPAFSVGKSLYQGNGTLDTDIDLEYNLAKGKIGDATYMALSIGKHRLATVVNEKYKNGFYKFPDSGPIALDAITGKSMFKTKLSGFASTSSDHGIF